MITTDAYSLYATVEESMCDATTAALRQGPYRTTLLYANELKRTESNQGTNTSLPDTRRRSTASIGYTFYSTALVYMILTIIYCPRRLMSIIRKARPYNKDGKAPTDCMQRREFYEAIALHGISGLPTSLARNTKRTLSTP